MTAQPLTRATQRIAVLGMGTMGSPIARNLLRAGFDVRVWNRNPTKAEALASDGALSNPPRGRAKLNV